LRFLALRTYIPYLLPAYTPPLNYVSIMAGLYGVPQAVAIFPQFIANQPETLVLKEHVMSLSGDSFSIKLANGTPILQVEGKVRYGNGGFESYVEYC
jgi:hypothetical protein